jgi:hypothetical protein
MAQKAGHTKGPWTSDKHGVVVLCSNHKGTRTYLPSITTVGKEDPAVIGAETQANARLIAAAPDLLAALKALHLQALQSELNDPANEWGYEAIQKAAAALAKAERA